MKKEDVVTPTTDGDPTPVLQQLLLRLQVVGRSTSASDDNHFVRLTPRTARRLRDNAGQPAPSPTVIPPTTVSSSTPRGQQPWWWIYPRGNNEESCKCESGIDFLPLRMTFERTGQIIYASYNGGNLHSSGHDHDDDDDNSDISSSFQHPTGNNADGLIDLPQCLLPDSVRYDMKDQPTFVTVHALEYMDGASELFVDPVTWEDWELLQHNAATLEEGRLLQQISVVYSGQVIRLAMSNGARASLVVLPRNFERNDENRVWPKDATADSINHGGRYPCYRLLADTQVIIAPKPRIPQHLVQHLFQLIPTRQDYEMFDCGMIELSKVLEVELVSVPQGVLILHPNTFGRIQDEFQTTTTALGSFAVVHAVPTTWRRKTDDIVGKSNHNDDNVSVTVKIIVSTTIPENHAAMHPFVRLRIQGALFTGRTFVSIQKFLAPIEITKRSTIVSDLVPAGAEVNVQFKRIQWQTPMILSPWCSPVTSGSGGGATEDYYAILSSNRKDSELSPHSVFNFGSIVQLPNRNSCSYRLDVQNSNDHPKSLKDGFLFTKQLLDFSDRFMRNEDSNLRESYETVLTEEAMSSRSLVKILPSSPFFPASKLRLVKAAFLRSSTLIHGDTGCGKTFTSLLIAAVARLKRGDQCVYLSCRKLRDSHTVRMKTILTELEQTFNDACELAPCVVILDDLDAIAPNFLSSEHSDNSALSHDLNPTEIDQSKIVSDVLRHLMRAKAQDVFVVATTSSTQSLSHYLTSKGYFNHQLAVPELDDNERKLLYRCFLKQFAISGEPSWSNDSNFIRQTNGFRPRDLELLAFRTMNYQSTQSGNIQLQDATSKILEGFVPLCRLASNTKDEVVPTCKLCDIGGLYQPKAELTATIVRPSLYRRIYAPAKVRLPRGVLLFGFPGTGKSMCVPALARECGYPLITCRGPELLDKYIGASEAKIRALFARAAAAAPSILFLDELDALAPRRGSDHTGVTDRIVNQLLTFLDGVEDVANGSTGRTVYVIGATSRPDKVDPALLRPGRLEKHIYFGLSDDLTEVKDLLIKISESYALEEEARAAVISGKFVEDVSCTNPLFPFFSAADFTSIFHAAQRMAVRNALDVGHLNAAAKISATNLVDAMRSARPSLSQPDYDRLSDIYSSYRQSKTHTSRLEVKQPMQSMLTALK